MLSLATATCYKATAALLISRFSISWCLHLEDLICWLDLMVQRQDNFLWMNTAIWIHLPWKKIQRCSRNVRAAQTVDLGLGQEKSQGPEHLLVWSCLFSWTDTKRLIPNSMPFSPATSLSFSSVPAPTPSPSFPPQLHPCFPFQLSFCFIWEPVCEMPLFLPLYSGKQQGKEGKGVLIIHMKTKYDKNLTGNSVLFNPILVLQFSWTLSCEEVGLAPVLFAALFPEPPNS